MLRIDAHQHVWDPARARYDWLGPDLSEIDRAISFEEIAPSLRRAGIDATVLVQSADNDEDTALMFETARAHPEIVAVVAYAPLEDARRTADLASRFAEDPLVVGVRNLIHDRPDPHWLLRPEVDAGLGVLEESGLAFDLVAVLPEHLELVPELGRRHPALRIVIDHLGAPPIGLGTPDPWWSLIGTAAENPLVHAKVSGLYARTADRGAWTPESVTPFVDRALDVFGADRLMYGGDWPISLMAGGYDRVWDALSSIIDRLDERERALVLGGTARRFYGIDEGLLDRARSAADQPSEGGVLPAGPPTPPLIPPDAASCSTLFG